LARLEVSELMNAVDCVLLTSFSEGSPQFIKEALACNKPIVSTNVGDVVKLLNDTKGNYIAASNVADVANAILKAKLFVEEAQQTDGREQIMRLGLDNLIIAKKIKSVYSNVLQFKK
jgi:glycosyltransferase involved in cell wall biosynthesis